MTIIHALAGFRGARRVIAQLTCALFLLLAVPAARAVGPYTITDLGTLGGQTSIARGINNLGQVVGCADTPLPPGPDSIGGAPHAFLYDNGVMTDLGTLVGFYNDASSCAFDINDLGQVVGHSSDSLLNMQAFLYSNGVMTDLGVLTGGFTSFAYRINNAGHVLIASYVGGGAYYQFLYFDGAMTVITPDQISDINDAGQIIGSQEPGRALLYDHGVVTLLGNLGGSRGTFAYDINNAGQIVGTSYLPGDVESRAFLYDNGVMTDLGIYDGRGSTAEMINESGQMLVSVTQQDWSSRTFLYENGVLTDVNTLLPPNSGWSYLLPMSINDKGQIVGQGLINNVWRAFLLTPVPKSICTPDGLQQSGSIYRICMPTAGKYNGDLVIWAHGFQDAGTPVQIPEDQLVINGLSIPEIVNTLGFGFATNSYSKTGLAVRQGMADILDLIEIYTAQHGAPNRVYLTGASEGGIITALLIEQHPDKFTGGLSACGPIGDFPYQINYFGDARVIFEMFFPGLIPGDPFNPDPSLVDNWATYYEQVVKPAVFAPANRNKLQQWVKVAKLPFDAGDFLNTVEVSVADVLRYAIVNAKDAATTLGGFPYDNRDRIYTGSDNDFLLNLRVPRLRADVAALTEMRTRYNTRGQLSKPLVTLHTTRDQQVPQPHQTFYTLKTISTGDFLSLHVPITVDRFEHCNFKAEEVLVSFGLLLQGTGYPLQASDLAAVVPLESQARFKALAEEKGLK